MALAKKISISDPEGIGAPITAFAAETMDKGDWGLSQRTEYYRNNPFSNNTLINDPQAESQTGTLFNYLMLNYGLSNSLTIGASLPYIYTSNLKIGQINDFNIPEILPLGNISGLSDLSLYALTQIIKDEQAPFLFSLILGLTLPTGKTNSRDSTGALFSLSDQPGNGGYSAIGGLVLSKEMKPIELSFNILYTQNTQGSQQTTIGSAWNYNVAAVYEFYRQDEKHHSLDAIVELNGAIVAEDTISGFKDGNSGGDNLLLLTGLRDNFKNGASMYFGLTFPLMERYHGAQVSTKYGLIGGIDLSLG